MYWLRAEGGVSRRITPGGLLIGRSPNCEIVTRNPKASRRQALVYLGDDGPRIVVMGRAAVAVDGTNAEGDVALGDESTIEIEEHRLAIVREDRPDAEPRAPAVWVLETTPGGLFSFSDSPFRVGGGTSDDLRIDGLPDTALTFRSTNGRLEVIGEHAWALDAEPVPAGESRRLGRGSILEIGEVELRVVTGGELVAESTINVESESEASAIRLEFLPRGGRLHVSAGGDDHSIYLTDRRCDFIAVLLQPPAPLSAGDFIPDEHLWARVWGKQPAGKKTLHVLLHRLRKDLDRVGLDGGALLERSEGGGATRFVLAPGAEVILD